jgi:hypothetical protein
MKKLFLLSLLVGITTLLTGCGSENVIDYNDKLVELTSKCFTAEGLVRDMMKQENYTSAKTLYETAVTTCKKSQTDTAEMKAYENDTSLRDAVNTLLQAEVLYLEKF